MGQQAKLQFPRQGQIAFQPPLLKPLVQVANRSAASVTL